MAGRAKRLPRQSPDSAGRNPRYVRPSTSPLQIEQVRASRSRPLVARSLHAIAPRHVQVRWKCERDHAEFFRDSRQRPADFRQAAAHIPAAELGLDERDDVEGRGRLIRRRAVVGREAEENLPQVRIGEAPFDFARERSRGRDLAEMTQLRPVSRREGAPEFRGRPVEIGLAGELINAARIVEKARHLGPRQNAASSSITVPSVQK